MGHQTKISEQNGSPKAASKGLARDVGEFAYDVLTLAELQAQLFVADVQQCGRRVLFPGVLLLGGLALALACFPIALAALAFLLIQVFEISHAPAFLIAALTGATLSALVSVIAWLQVRRHMAILGRSQQELVRNLRWIKKVLERSRITRKNSIDNSWRTVT
jgi:hypothetical protein